MSADPGHEPGTDAGDWDLDFMGHMIATRSPAPPRSRCDPKSWTPTPKELEVIKQFIG